jgi:hypothetical protein
MSNSDEAQFVVDFMEAMDGIIPPKKMMIACDTAWRNHCQQVGQDAPTAAQSRPAFEVSRDCSPPPFSSNLNTYCHMVSNSGYPVPEMVLALARKEYKKGLELLREMAHSFDKSNDAVVQLASLAGSVEGLRSALSYAKSSEESHPQ